MIRLNEAIAILIPIFNLFISHGMCNSRFSHYELQDIDTHNSANSHYPVQPELVRTLENCHKSSGAFDLCIKNAMNELRVYYKTGKFNEKKTTFSLHGGSLVTLSIVQKSRNKK